MIKFIVTILMAILLLPCSVLASELYGTIWYKGKPLQNAEITIRDEKIRTNNLGYYSVRLDPGKYTLVIKLPDGKVKEEKVDVFPQDTEKNMKLE